MSNLNKCHEVVEFISKYTDIFFRIIIEETKNNNIKIEHLVLTRCFTTVFVILFIMFGASKTNETIEYCWNQPQNFNENGKHVSDLKELIIKNKNITDNMIYFITINTFKMGISSDLSNELYNEDLLMRMMKENKRFPGHVLLIEQYTDVNGIVIYKLYQSYLNTYTMEEFRDGSKKSNFFKSKINNSFIVSLKELSDVLNELHSFFKNGEIWTDSHTNIWKDLSLAEEDFNGYIIRDMKFCYKCLKINDNKCFDRIYNLVKKYKKDFVIRMNKRITNDSKVDFCKFIGKYVLRLYEKTDNVSEKNRIEHITRQVVKNIMNNQFKENDNLINLLINDSKMNDSNVIEYTEEYQKEYKNLWSNVLNNQLSLLTLDGIFGMKSIDSDRYQKRYTIEEYKEIFDNMESEIKSIITINNY
jgi:hypothetical protein